MRFSGEGSGTGLDETRRNSTKLDETRRNSKKLEELDEIREGDGGAGRVVDLGGIGFGGGRVFHSSPGRMSRAPPSTMERRATW
jgi:hypothetical protein